MQVIGSEIRAKVGTLAEDRAILHETIAQERFLAGDHIGTGEQGLTGRSGYHARNGWLTRVRLIREETEHQET